MTGRLAFAFVLSLILAYPLRTQEQPTHPFPTKDQITLLVSQAERAFDSYASAVQLESQLSGETSAIEQMIAKDRDVLRMGRQVIGDLKRDSDHFNSPMGFLLVGNLDDASRNMALCASQAGMEAATDMQRSNSTAAFGKLHVAQSCQDTGVLIFTVSETAFSLYANYLEANHDAMQSLLQEVQRCLGILKNQKKG